jgi:hypothetical protein
MFISVLDISLDLIEIEQMRKGIVVGARSGHGLDRLVVTLAGEPQFPGMCAQLVHPIHSVTQLSKSPTVALSSPKSRESSAASNHAP